MKNYDAVIIGFGKAGKTLAADLAGRGKKRFGLRYRFHGHSQRY